MKWFQGSIEEAILASKQRNAVFVVYIEGKDADSSNMTKMIEDQAVATKLESENFVAIKLDSGSQSYTQFVQIYQLVPVPSLFFIGKNGQPIEVIPQKLQKSKILEKIEQILEKAGYKSSANGSVSTSLTKSDVKNETGNFIQSESSTAPVKTGAIKKETSLTVDQKLSNENASKEEKIERARQLIEQKREAKKIQDEEIEKNKEIERRKMGQEVQKMRRDQHEKELQQLREERLREKNDEIAARQRILAQIAQDKADRAKKFSMQNKNDGPQPETSSTPTEKVQKPVSNKDYNRACLQFRLSDGSTHTNDFDISTTLGEVINYINANLNLPYRHFVLATTFPRIQFESSDNSKTLLALQLVPNAVILILPVRSSQAVTASSPNGFAALIWSLMTPFIHIFEYLRGSIFRRGNSNADARVQEQEVSINDRATSVITGKRRVGDGSVIHRQTGNIHRLSDHNSRDSDEDNNTWNGNSTQQM